MKHFGKGAQAVPYIQIELDRDLYESKADEISAAIHAAQWELPELGIPESDLFQVFHPREPGEIVFDPQYNGVDRQNLIVLQVLLVYRHPISQKQALYANIVAKLGEVGIRPEDILIILLENGFEDWKLSDATEAARAVLAAEH
ncbi:tautomerase family protein [Gryllotalpicola protaetiae]|uniref:Tautomerase family protein n=2 Tax=Gryllotalpicola protaetiae TaxID=2419771 RepID=A0A387BN52_9MICO|nr:tautomerase family protein [Gryllotalpicola protaetiae]